MTMKIRPRHDIQLTLLAFAWICLFTCDALAQSPVPPPRLLRNKPLSVVFEPKDMAVLAAEVSGKVVRVDKNMGDEFKQGEVLVEIDPVMYKASLQRAEAVAGAMNKGMQVTAKMREYESASALDQENAKKDAMIASANLNMAKRELALTKVEAPFPGLVRRVLVRAHEWVEKGRPVLEVVNDNLLKANILLPSSLFGKVKVGQEVTVSVTETEANVKCRITQISKVLDPASGTFEVYGEVANADGTLRGGMTGTLSENL